MADEKQNGKEAKKSALGKGLSEVLARKDDGDAQLNHNRYRDKVFPSATGWFQDLNRGYKACHESCNQGKGRGETECADFTYLNGHSAEFAEPGFRCQGDKEGDEQGEKAQQEGLGHKALYQG